MKKYALQLLLTTVIGLSLSGASLALISDRSELEDLTTLIAAALPDDLQLLERDELNRIAAELQLQQDWNASSLETAQRIAQLDRADLLAVLHREAETRTLQLTVFDRELGIRVGQARLGGRDLNAQAENAAAALAAAMERRQRLREQNGVTLSFLPSSYIDVMPGAEPFVRRAGSLLAEAFLERTDVIVLERDFLIRLSQEPGWNQLESVKSLLAGTFLVHLEVIRGRRPEEQLYTLKILRPDSAEALLEYAFYLDAESTGRERIDQLVRQMRFPAIPPGERAAEARSFAAHAFAGALQNRLEEALAAALQAEVLGDGSRQSVELEIRLTEEQWRAGNHAEALHHFDAATRRALHWGIDDPQLRQFARGIRPQSSGDSAEAQQLAASYQNWLDGFILMPLTVNARELTQAQAVETQLELLVEQAELLRQLHEYAPTALYWKYVFKGWKDFNAAGTALLPALAEAARKRTLQQRVESSLRECVVVPPWYWTAKAVDQTDPQECNAWRQLAELQLANPFYENALTGAWELAILDHADPETPEATVQRIKEIFSRPVLLPAALPPQMQIQALPALMSGLPLLRQLELHDLLYRKIKGYQPLRELVLTQEMTLNQARAVRKAVLHWGGNRKTFETSELLRNRLSELQQRFPELEGEK